PFPPLIDPDARVYIMSQYKYLQDYADGGTWAPSTSPGTVDKARAAVHAIRNKQKVSIPMLESVVSLTYYFESLIELLDDPGLIEDCVILLSQREKKGEQVFDDEWGYLCFRVLVLSINASMVSKYRHPAAWDTLSSMHGKQDADRTLSESGLVVLSSARETPCYF
ncbi:unnamed protein product, partial [Rhizoctonia solani]